MSFEVELSQRLKKLPPYLFAEIDRSKREAKAQGRDIIDLGIGDPDLPTPPFIVEALKKAAEDGGNHHYALDAGMPQFRKTISCWLEKRFNISINPDTEVYPVIGSKEGLTHLPLGIINPKDRVLIPDPCYPAYRSAVMFAGGEVINLNLSAENNFLPNLSEIKNAKALFLNYPNNPTASVMPKAFLKDLVKIAKKENIILISDLAYSEVYYDNEKPPSLLEIPGAKDISIEFHSLSKTFYMTGWRVGFACGNQKLITALSKVKANIDSGIFQAIQVAAQQALEGGDHAAEEMRALFQERRDTFVKALTAIGWNVPLPKATFYIWAPIPNKFQHSMQTAATFLKDADIVATPGIGFGNQGEGFIRMTITMDKQRLEETAQRLKKII